MRRVRYVAVIAASIGLLSVAAAGCGGGDDNSSDATTASSTSPGGDLFTQTTHTGTLKPIAGQNDVFTLTFDQPSPDVTVFTDRPVRSASTEPLPGFVQSWDTRGFNSDPPNAALVLDQEPDNADTAIFELSHPALDPKTGAVSYTAKHVNGGTASLPSDEHIDPPPSFGDAHLFIDPSGGGDVHDLAISVVNNEGNGGRVTITFDPPWEVFLSSDQQEISYLVGPNPGGGSLRASTVTLNGPGGLEFQLDGGTGAITGTASFRSGNGVSVQVDDNPQQTISNGKFSLAP